MARCGLGSFTADGHFASRHYGEQIDCDVQDACSLVLAISALPSISPYRSVFAAIVPASAFRFTPECEGREVTVVRELGRSPFSQPQIRSRQGGPTGPIDLDAHAVSLKRDPARDPGTRQPIVFTPWLPTVRARLPTRRDPRQCQSTPQ